MDYIFRWLAAKFLSSEEQERVGVIARERDVVDESIGATASDGSDETSAAEAVGAVTVFNTQEDAPSCPDCGSIMVRNGACYKCVNCGSSLGCS